MANPNRATITVDGTKFDAISASVVFETQKGTANMPNMGSLTATVRCLVNFHDQDNLPHSALSKLFGLANVVTKDKVKDMKVEFWTDETRQNALVSYSFKGWISNFQTWNPAHSPNGNNNGDSINHVLVLTLQPQFDEQNFSNMRIGN